MIKFFSITLYFASFAIFLILWGFNILAINYIFQLVFKIKQQVDYYRWQCADD